MASVETRAAQRWQPLQDGELCAATLRVALDVANRLREPAQIEAAALEAKLQSGLKGGPQWVPYSLAQGYAGIALVFEQLDRCFPDDGWDALAYEYLEIAAHGAVAGAELRPSAFGGLGSLAFTAWYLSRSGARYQRLVATVDQSLIAKVRALIANLRGRREGVAVEVFDTISGLSGLGAYLLRRLDSPEIRVVLTDAINSLVELSQDDNGLPRWHTPSHLSSPDDFMLQLFPSGYLNCGLAHGIPGPLGTLSLARMNGLSCEGLEDAIDRLATWLVNHRLDDEWGINWPVGVGLLAQGDPAGRIAAVDASPIARAGWCYGSPGVARSLYFAGLALQKQEYCALAVRAIEAVLRRPVRARQIESPTFCHGVAGLLEIVLRFANDTSAATMLAGATALTKQLLSLYEPESLLGFRSIGVDGNRVDQPGLLDGAPGVALVLLATARDVEPGWDRIFLLS